MLKTFWNDVYSSAVQTRGITLSTQNSQNARYVYECKEELIIPDYQLHEEKEIEGSVGRKTIVRLSILENDIKESVSYYSSTIQTEEFDFVGVEKRNFVHDYVFEILSKETDYRLDRWVALYDDEDVLTPDHYSRQNDFNIFMEFATNASNFPKAMIDNVKNKLEKYTGAIETRMQHRNSKLEIKESVSLLTIVVSHSTVVTNFPIQETEIIPELCLRYRLAVDISKHLERMSLIQSQREQDLSDDMFKVKRMFESMQFKENFHDPLGRCLTLNQMKNFVEKPPNPKIINNITSEILKIAKDNTEGLNSGEKEEMTEGDTDKITFKSMISDIDIEKNILQTEEVLRNYESKFEEEIDGDQFRFDLKSIIHFPAIDVKKDCSSSTSHSDPDAAYNDLPYISDESDNVTVEIWKDVIRSINQDYVSMSDETVEEQYERALNPNKYNDPKSRRNYHRVTVDLSRDDLIDCAKVGMWSKAWLNHSIVKSYRMEKKKPFNLKSDTSDIENFINFTGMELFDEAVGLHPTNETVLSIIEEGIKLHGSIEINDQVMNTVTKIMQTKLMSWMKIISDIAVEISVSVKQHVNKQEFIIKKLKDYDIFILIRTTSQEGLINFSLCWKKEDLISIINSTVFPNIIQTQDYCMTEFRSVNLDKLHNLNLAESMIFNITTFFLNEYKINVFNDDFDLSDRTNSNLVEAKKMILTSILCFLEDKKQTEMVITNIRYVYMEGFVAYPKLPNPGKMVAKLPLNPKSRLSVFFIQKTIDLMRYIVRGNFFSPIKRVTNEGEIRSVRKNIINFITGKEVEDLNVMINLMYIGYLNNKQELMQGNKVNSIYKKIIEMEIKFTKSTQENIGIIDHDNFEEVKTHDYSISMLKYALNMANKKLSSTRGQNYLTMIEEDILRKFSLVNVTSVFGSLKSSSTFDSENDFSFEVDDVSTFASAADRKKLFKENMKPTRTKVLLAGAQSLIKYPKYHDLLMHSTSEIIKKDRLDVDLFDKAQHGGIREIFILDFDTRVAQFGMELISRTICSYFPSEMMTNSMNKDTHLENHKLNATKSFGKHGNIFVACSDDAEKWNQAHYVGKFAQMLCWFTPQYMWAFICNVTDLWFKRRIKIDSRLIQIMEQNEDLMVEDEVFQKLYNIYKGRESPVSWYQGNKKRYIEIKSGFMQGILHYTSSLFHVITLELIMKISSDLLTILVTNLNLPERLKLINYMVSSDDSALFMTLPASNMSELKKSLMTSAFIFETKTQISKALGIYKSIKSTQNTIHCMEFNSIFNFSESRYQAYIKQVIASTTVSEKESLVARQEEQSTSLTSILENGGSNLLCEFCQVGQALLFYRLLGSSVVPIITRKIIPKLKDFKDPSLGFFLMDNPLICGIMGFKYNLWNLVQEEPLISGLYKFMLNNALAKEATDVITSKKMDLTTTKTGLFTNSLIIPYGENAKLSRAQDSLNATKEVYEKVNENPMLLYKKPDTPESVEMHLQLKLLSPGVTEAFSRGKGLTKLMAQSVYLTTNAILSESSNWYSNESTLRTKTSLLKRLVETINLIDDFSEGLSPEEYDVLFPSNGDYERVKGNINMISKLDLIPKIKHTRNVKTKIQITDHEAYLVPPTQLVAWKWFKKQIPYTTRVLEDLWERLILAIKWLSTSPKETLVQGPFSNHHQIQNFFARMQDKSRFIRLIGAPVNTGSSSSNIYTVACRNVWKGYELPLVFDSDKKIRFDEYQSIRHSIFMILNSPFTKEYKLTSITDVLLTSKKIIAYDKSYSNKRSALSALKEFCKLKNSPNAKVKDFIHHMLSHKYGVLGGFVQRQDSHYDKSINKRVYTGTGIWSGQIGNVNVEIHIQSEFEKNTTNSFNYISELYINKRTVKPEFLEDLRKLCYDMNILNCTPKYYDTSKTKYLRIAWLRNFTISRAGTPIFYKTEISTINDIRDLSELSLELTRSTINVKFQKSNDKNYWYNLISYTVSSNDFDLTLPKEVYDKLAIKPFLIAWIKNEPFPYKHIINLIKIMIEQPETTPEVDRADFFEWAHDCFMSILRRMGIIKETKILKNLEVEDYRGKPDQGDDNDMSETYAFFEDMMDNLDKEDFDIEEFSLMVGPDHDEFNEDINLEDFSEELADVLLGLQQETIESQVLQTNDNVRKNNGTFYNVCQQLIVSLGKDNLKKLVNEKLYQKGMSEETLEIISYLMKKNPQDFKEIEIGSLKINSPDTSISTFI